MIMYLKHDVFIPEYQFQEYQVPLSKLEGKSCLVTGKEKRGNHSLPETRNMMSYHLKQSKAFSFHNSTD